MTTRARRMTELLVTMAVCAAAAVAFLALWGGFPHDPTTFEVLRTDTVDGELQARVRWVDDDGIPHVGDVPLPQELKDADRVALAREPDGSLVAVAPEQQESWWFVGFAAVAGALFGVTVIASTRGLGFLTGRGEAGTTSPERVREDRGFYWRW